VLHHRSDAKPLSRCSAPAPVARCPVAPHHPGTARDSPDDRRQRRFPGTHRTAPPGHRQRLTDDRRQRRFPGANRTTPPGHRQTTHPTTTASAGCPMPVAPQRCDVAKGENKAAEWKKTETALLTVSFRRHLRIRFAILTIDLSLLLTGACSWFIWASTSAYSNLKLVCGENDEAPSQQLHPAGAAPLEPPAGRHCPVGPDRPGAVDGTVYAALVEPARFATLEPGAACRLSNHRRLPGAVSRRPAEDGKRTAWTVLHHRLAGGAVQEKRRRTALQQALQGVHRSLPRRTRDGHAGGSYPAGGRLTSTLPGAMSPACWVRPRVPGAGPRFLFVRLGGRGQRRVAISTPPAPASRPPRRCWKEATG